MSNRKEVFGFNRLSGEDANWPDSWLRCSIMSLISKLGTRLPRESVPNHQRKPRVHARKAGLHSGASPLVD